MPALEVPLTARGWIMWLSEPTETFPLTHAVELYLIFRAVAINYRKNKTEHFMFIFTLEISTLISPPSFQKS